MDGTSGPMQEDPQPLAADPHTPAQDIFCPYCAYNVRGLPANRCPECGREFDPAVLAASALPWPQRRKIGWFRAYWRTVWLVVFHSRRFCGEFSFPVSYPDAQRFRWLTVLHVYLCILVPSIAYCLLSGQSKWRYPLLQDLMGDAWGVVALQVAGLCALGVVTGLPSYWFHPRRLPIAAQNRAIALSYYASAPLALMPLAVGMAVALTRLLPAQAIGARVLLAVALITAPWWAWLASLVRLAGHTTRRDSAGLLSFAIGLPALWLVLGGLTFVGVGLVLDYLGLVYYSLRP